MRNWRPRGGFEWTPAEDRRLLKDVERQERREVQPWQAKPIVDWIKIAQRHERSVLAVRSRVTVLRAAPRLAYNLKAKR